VDVTGHGIIILRIIISTVFISRWIVKVDGKGVFSLFVGCMYEAGSSRLPRALLGLL
jgi:hypothetical protein